MASDNSRLSFRLAPDHKELIEKAAAALGQSVSDFAIGSLVRAARETIHAEHTTTLTLRDAQEFLRILKANDQPNEALKKAMARHRAARG